MDTETVSVEDYRAYLENLATVNALTLTHGPVLTWLDRATRGEQPADRVTVLDVGTGIGDLLRRVHAWSRHRGRGVNLVRIDLKEKVVIFIRWMDRVATRGCFMADRHWHMVPLYAFRFLSQLACWTRFVPHDGPMSIARRFRRADWEQFLHSAGLDLSTVTIPWHGPFRLCVSRFR